MDFGKPKIAARLLGDPLLDAQGRLVGINTIMAGPDVGLAVTVHLVKKFLKERLGSEGQFTRPPTPL